MWTAPLLGDLQRANPHEILASVLPGNQMQGALPVPRLGVDRKPQLRIGGVVWLLWQIPSLRLRFFARSVHMPHQVSLVNHPKHVGYALGGNRRDSRAGSIPI